MKIDINANKAFNNKLLNITKENSKMENCPNCSKPLPTTGFFCGVCLTQFKCKTCETILQLDYAGCVNCGTAKDNRNSTVTGNTNANTFRLHETPTDRTIEATFSDAVGKDLAGILRDSYASKLANQAGIKKLTGTTGEHEYLPLPEETTIDAEVVDTPDNPTPKSNEAPQQLDNFPTLLAVAMRNLPASETEWIVVYSFYASNYGDTIFTRDNILEKYEESNRFNKTTTNRDLTTYIKRTVNSDYINPLQNGYSLLEKGIEKAKEILGRSSSSSPKSGKTRSKASKTTNANSEAFDQTKNSKRTQKLSSKSSLKRLSNLDLAPSGVKSLEAFYKEWNAKNNNENNLLFVYYLQEILKVEAISRSHIYTCYDALGLVVPENFTVSINNTVVRKGWIQTQNGIVSLTTKGTNHLKTWKNKAK